MNKRIKVTEKEMCNYFVKEQKVIEYGQEFFKEICACSMNTKDCLFVNDNVIPLSCFNLMDELLYALDYNKKQYIQGGFVKACQKQAYIRIGIDTKNSILTKTLKRTIRHEIIHYYLWLFKLPHDDDSLEFWCLCYAFDGGAYEALTVEKQEYYNLFKELYTLQVENLPWNIKHILIGQMIMAISKVPIENYPQFINNLICDMKNLFDVK